MDWQPEPHAVDPDIAHAVDHLNELLPTLSDNTDRVLRASELVPNTFEALVARLSAGERRELFREMRP